MNRRILTLCIAALLIVLSACGTKPVEPPQVSDAPPTTEVTAELPLESDEGDSELSTDDTPQTTARPQLSPIVLPVENGNDYVPEEGENTWTEYMFSDFHPIVYNGILLGGSYGDGMWIDAESVAEYVLGTELYTLYDETGAYSNGFGTAVFPDDGSRGPYTQSVEVREFAPVDMNDVNNVGLELPLDVLALSANWDAMPRVATSQSLNNPTYNKIVNASLKGYGIDIKDSDVNIVQHFRLDFEGDGVDEVVIYAESPTDGWRFGVTDGAYSILLIRKVFDGVAKTMVVHGDYHYDVEAFYEENGYYALREVGEICGFYDLNGDGTLELVTKSEYYEGYSYNIHEISSGFVMSNGLGA